MMEHIFIQICAKTNKRRTFQELRESIISAAVNLRNLGCRKGHVVTFITNETGDIASMVCAALCLGATIAGQFTNYKEFERLYFFNLIQPDFVVCDIQYYMEIKECLAKLDICAKILTFGGQINGSYSVESLFEFKHVDPNFM